MSDIKAELRLIREKCPTVWNEMTMSEGRLCPLYFGLENHNGLPLCLNHGSLKECKDCWDKAIESECVRMSNNNKNIVLICPKCGSNEVYYENPRTGNGLYNCDDCGFSGKENIFTESDVCQECHNALVCLAWAKDGIKAKCEHANYFKKHYVSGKEKIIGAELLDGDEAE